MNFNQMLGGRFSPQVSTGNQGSLLPPPQPPYKKGEVSLQQMEPQNVYLPYGKQYAEERGVTIVFHLEAALQERAKGRFVLTLREADIAARAKIPLDSEFLQKSLVAVTGFLDEGPVGVEDSAYFLRSFYNRGVTFKSSGEYDRSSDAKKERADKTMQEICLKLTERQLPPWPEELTVGFATELCKPEYMTWKQYEDASRNPVRIINPNGDSHDLCEQREADCASVGV